MIQLLKKKKEVYMYAERNRESEPIRNVNSFSYRKSLLNHFHLNQVLNLPTHFIRLAISLATYICP